MTFADPRAEQIAAKVRAVLEDRVERQLDPLDREYLNNAANATAVILILNARANFGPLLDDQAAAYLRACGLRDAALKALGIDDPYRAAVN